MAIVAIVVGVIGISGRILPAIRSGDTDFLRLNLQSAVLAMAFFLLVMAAGISGLQIGMICLRRVRKRFADDYVFGARMDMDLARRLKELLAVLTLFDRRPPLWVLTVKADVHGLSFWVGIRHSTKFLDIPWAAVRTVRVVHDRTAGRGSVTLNIELLNAEPSMLGLSVLRDRRLGTSVLNQSELQQVGHRLEALRADSRR